MKCIFLEGNNKRAVYCEYITIKQQLNFTVKKTHFFICKIIFFNIIQCIKGFYDAVMLVPHHQMEGARCFYRRIIWTQNQ